MDRGSLGESDENDEFSESFHNGTHRLIFKPYNRSKTGETIEAKQRTTSTESSARRKQSRPDRDTKALKEIKKLQQTTNLVIPKLPFGRLVRQISLQTNPEITRYSLAALQALQEASEMYLTQVLQDAYYLTMHRKCVTLSKADLILLRYLKIDK